MVPRPRPVKPNLPGQRQNPTRLQSRSGRSHGPGRSSLGDRIINEAHDVGNDVGNAGKHAAAVGASVAKSVGHKAHDLIHKIPGL